MLAFINAPMDSSSMTSGESTDGSEFEAYARLLRALLPRLTGVSIFSASCELVWSNDMVVEPALLRIVGESMRSARDQPGDPGILINDGEPTYIFWLWRMHDSAPTEPYAAVLLRCKANGGRSAHARLRARAGAPGPGNTGSRAAEPRADQEPERLARRAGRRPRHAAVGQHQRSGQRRRRRRRTQGDPARRGRAHPVRARGDHRAREGPGDGAARTPSTPSMPAWWRAPTGT